MGFTFPDPEFESFESDESDGNPVILEAEELWREQFVNAGYDSIAHPRETHRAHALRWFEDSRSLRNPDSRIRESARYFFAKGQAIALGMVIEK